MMSTVQLPLGHGMDFWEDVEVPRKTHQERASFTFRGPAVDGGEMSASEFGQALIGYSKMVGQVARTLDPRVGDVEVRVISTERGSFQVALNIFVDLTYAEAVWDWLKSADGDALARAVTIVGGGAGGAAFVHGVASKSVRYLKELRGRRVIERQSVDAHNDLVLLEDGEDILALAKAVDVAETPAFRKAVRDFTSPLTKAGIETVTLDSEADGETVSPSDRHWFEEVDEPDLIEEERMRLRVERIAFDGSPWRFLNVAPAGGEAQYYLQAAIDDEEFLAQVAARRLTFADGDELEAIVEVAYPRTPRKGARRRYRIRSVVTVLKDGEREEDPLVGGDGFDLSV